MGSRLGLRLSFDALAVGGAVCLSAASLLAAAEEGRAPVRSARPCAELRAARCRALIRREHAEELERTGLVVIEGALSEAQLKGTRRAVRDLDRRRVLGPSPNADPSVRTDRMAFLESSGGGGGGAGGSADADARADADAAPPGLRDAMELLRGVGAALTDAGFRGFGGEGDQDRLRLRVPDQVQVALYGAGGAHYRAHRDGVSGGVADLGLLAYLRTASYRSRAVTCILYINEGPWEGGDGGNLRLYLDADADDDDGATARAVRDVAPAGGRLVLFDSQALLHSVTPAHRERMACTIWLVREEPWMAGGAGAGPRAREASG